MKKNLAKNWTQMNTLQRVFVSLYPKSMVSIWMDRVVGLKNERCNVSIKFFSSNEGEDFTKRTDLIVLANGLGWIVVSDRNYEFVISK